MAERALEKDIRKGGGRGRSNKQMEQMRQGDRQGRGDILGAVKYAPRTSEDRDISQPVM